MTVEIIQWAAKNLDYLVGTVFMVSLSFFVFSVVQVLRKKREMVSASTALSQVVLSHAQALPPSVITTQQTPAETMTVPQLSTEQDQPLDNIMFAALLGIGAATLQKRRGRSLSKPIVPEKKGQGQQQESSEALAGVGLGGGYGTSSYSPS
jgi:hypothetical protein